MTKKEMIETIKGIKKHTEEMITFVKERYGYKSEEYNRWICNSAWTIYVMDALGIEHDE